MHDHAARSKEERGNGWFFLETELVVNSAQILWEISLRETNFSYLFHYIIPSLPLKKNTI